MSLPSSSPLASPTPSTVSSSSSFVMLSADRLGSLSGSLSHNMTSSLYDSDDEIVYSISEGSSSSSDGSTESYPASDDDFVVLSRPRSPGSTALETGLSTPSGEDVDRANTPITARLVADLENLTVSDSGSTSSGGGSQHHKSTPTSPVSPSNVGPKKKRKSKAARAAARAAAGSYPSPLPSPTRATPASPTTKQVKDVVKAKPKKSKKKKATLTTSVLSSPAGFRARSIVDDMSERFSENGDTESTAAPTIYEEAVGFITS